MGKKRSRGQAAAAPSRTHNDTFDDSEDEFIKGRDQILLDEGPAAKRRRRLEKEEAELMPSDEEVYEEADGVDEDEFDAYGDDSEDEQQAFASEDDEDERYWGTDRADYYNADAIETEQDALDEEAEARRLHQKQLQDMTEADYGFDELAWAGTEEEAARKPLVEKLPPVQVPKDATDEQKMEILRSRYPEFELLVHDLTSLYPVLQQIQQDMLEEEKGEDVVESTLIGRYQALSAYLAAIALYVAVLTSSKDGLALPPAALRDHPIMTSLLRAKKIWDAAVLVESWEKAKGESEPPSDSSEDVSGLTKTGPSADSLDKAKKQKKMSTTTAPTRLVPAANAELPAVTGKEVKKLTATLPLGPAKKKKSKAKDDKPKRATLEDLIASAEPVGDQDSDFGDEIPLTAEEAAEKARKKKSLRFYTSQIAQKAGKRAAASRQAGGDDDLPYKERIRDRQERLQREVAQQRGVDGDDLDGDDDDYDENDLASKMNTDANDYYSTMVGATAQKKADKAARAEAHRQAAAQGAQVYEEEVVGKDGKRKITYAIEKNKGLAPKRKKEVRNPRVKKKMKYEEKKKKLASMRPTWKGGEGKGGYKGELTGIKSNLVKSVKL